MLLFLGAIGAVFRYSRIQQFRWEESQPRGWFLRHSTGVDMATANGITVRFAQVGDLPKVLTIHRQQKRWLGHLPNAVFEKAVEEGLLLVAHSNGDTVGYLLYRERKSAKDVAVVHLAVVEEYQRRGVATLLVQGLIEAASGSRRITLRCRKDYPAHSFWMNVGFEAVAESPGNSVRGALLTTFERRLQMEPSLFDELYEASEPFAVDLDVLLDLATDRPQGSLTRDVFLQLEQFDTHPLRTRSLLNELSNHKDDAVRAHARAVASGWQEAQRSAEASEIEDLAKRVPGLSPGDRRHLADAEVNGVDVLLSRDVQFSTAVAHAAPGATPVRVIEPAAFVDQLMAGDQGQYHPAAVAGLSVVGASRFGVAVLANAFVCQGDGEKKTDLRAALRSAFVSARTGTHALVRSGDLIACLSLTNRDGLLEVGILRVSHHREAASLARHAVAWVRRQAVAMSDVSAIRVSDPHLSSVMERALVAEGFTFLDGEWVAFAMQRRDSVRDVEQALAALYLPDPLGALRWRMSSLLTAAGSDSATVAMLEQALDPLVIADSVVPAVIVPIQAQFSDRLLGVSSSQLGLDMTDPSIGAYREHVYFRSDKGMKIAVPCRVFWYRTKDSPSRIFAVSTIDKIVVSDLDHVWGRFGGYGVLSRSDVEDVGDAGRLMAIRFVRTRRLRREITLAALRQQALELGIGEPPVPYSVRRLAPELATWILSEVGVR